MSQMEPEGQSKPPTRIALMALITFLAATIAAVYSIANFFGVRTLADLFPQSPILRLPREDPDNYIYQNLYGEENLKEGCASMGFKAEIKVCDVEPFSGTDYVWGMRKCFRTKEALLKFNQEVRLEFSMDGNPINGDKFWKRTDLSSGLPANNGRWCSRRLTSVTVRPGGRMYYFAMTMRVNDGIPDSGGRPGTFEYINPGTYVLGLRVHSPRE